ncbi:MAG: hypothetical protein ACOX2O_03270 [Bdellovibrionota bacterium]|jgi:DNA-directed RNA polymerase specialized sigma subunit
MGKEEDTQETVLSIEEANDLILEHRGWAESIAKSVARSWNLDWQLDGLDGAAMEALIFCARRFDPARGVPFKGYARKRIHEAATEASRRSKGWRRGGNTSARTERLAREVSVELFNIFPELHAGLLPYAGDEDADQDTRIALQRLLIGASVIATKQGIEAALPDDALDFKRMIESICSMEPLHQTLIWKVYWEGFSLRSVAGEWETDELNVIREHKVILDYLQKFFGKGRNTKCPRIRPGLREVAVKLKRQDNMVDFSQIMTKE